MLGNLNIFNFNLGRPPWPVWAAVVIAVPIAAVLYVAPAAVIDRIENLTRALPGGTSFPIRCTPLRVVLPAGADNKDITLFFKAESADEVRNCNPAHLRDSKVSAVTDVGRYRYRTWAGGRATLTITQGSATVGIVDSNIGGQVMALQCEPKPRVLMARWGTFVPRELKLLDIKPPDDLVEICRRIY